MKVYILLLFFSLNGYGEVLERNENGDFTITKKSFRIKEILKDYAEFFNYNLILPQKMKDSEFLIEGKKIIPKDRIENYISSLLYHNDSGIIQSKNAPFIEIIDAQDLKFKTVPIYNRLEELPPSNNQVQFNYQLKHIKSSEFARNMRPFLGRHGRIIDVVRSNTIHIVDTGKNIRRIIEMAQELDSPGSK